MRHIPFEILLHIKIQQQQRSSPNTITRYCIHAFLLKGVQSFAEPECHEELTINTTKRRTFTFLGQSWSFGKADERILEKEVTGSEDEG